MSKIKTIPKDQRKPHRERMFSTNFPEGFKQNPDIKCFVPWEDYLLLKNKYHNLFKRYKREK